MLHYFLLLSTRAAAAAMTMITAAPIAMYVVVGDALLSGIITADGEVFVVGETFCPKQIASTKMGLK